MRVGDGVGVGAGDWDAAVVAIANAAGAGDWTVAVATPRCGGISINRTMGDGAGASGNRRAMVSLAADVPSVPQVGQATRVGIRPFTGSTSNA